MIKYEVSKYSDEIKSVEVVKETDKTVWVKTDWFGKESIRQNRKDSYYTKLFDSWDEAKNYMIISSERVIESYKRNMDDEIKRLNKIKSMVQS